MNTEKLSLLRKGTVIPASPLALDKNRRFEERYQRAVYRYYAAAGAGGIAVGVHTTQFEIREPHVGLFKPVLQLAAEELASCEKSRGKPLLRIAGVCGETKQALAEAELARELNYDAVLLSLAALKETRIDAMVEHCQQVAGVMPLIGFYLQPAVGGRVLPYSFWRRFAEIENVVAIKIAPFNRYQTIDVVRAVGEAGRAGEITLYTGNDDSIVADLVTPFSAYVKGTKQTLRIKGGLLGQWCVYTKAMVELLDEIHSAKEASHDLLQRGMELTDTNAAVFDAANQFAGVIPGINEVLRRKGLLPTNLCIDKSLSLSPGQAEELDRVERAYPWLLDDEFIERNRDEWLR